MARYFRLSIMVCIVMACAAVSAFSQAAGPNSEPAKVEAPAQAVTTVEQQSKEIAVYGEVQAVNAALNTFSVQYYDYDSDSEKTSEITLGQTTKMENAKTLGDIKKGDWVDVTYTVSDGKNMARMVSVEKEEPATEPAAGAAAADLPSE